MGDYYETLGVGRGANADEIKKALSPQTRAIMPVHVYGNPCDMKSIMEIAKENSLLVLEDCCEALGATFDNRPVGSIGDIGTYSFYFSHHINALQTRDATSTRAMASQHSRSDVSRQSRTRSRFVAQHLPRIQ